MFFSGICTVMGLKSSVTVLDVRNTLFHVPCNTPVSVSLAKKGAAKNANI